MTNHSGELGRQIMRSVVTTAIASAILAIAGLYIFYGILTRVAPQLAFTNAWLPSGLEWLVILLLCGIAALISRIVASSLARSIVCPIVAVAETARRIADGDLAARADVDAESLSEVSMLVDDFNVLAERLERASLGVAQWNATIAHELRTPMTILRGRLQGLADGVFDPTTEMFRSLEKHATSLCRLINDLRTVTLFDAGHLAINTRKLDLVDTVASTVRFMTPELEAAGFKVETQLEPSVCDADDERVRQALIALLENVKRHAVPGTVRVTMMPLEASIRIQVCDSGPGLPAEFQRYAFDAFVRYIVEGVVMNGSGLGLSVVRAVAEIHGGQASYVPLHGGSCFIIDLPGANVTGKKSTIGRHHAN